MQPRTWRRWHRWLGWTAALFLLFAGTTGTLVAATEFFGADEAERERLRELVSPVTAAAAASEWSEPMQRAFAAMSQRAPGAPIDKVEIKWKAEPPTVTVYTGRRGGGEDKRFVFEARTGNLLETGDYVDKPFLYRLHSGEAFGDGGLVVAMGWGLALVLLTLSGTVIYWQMRRPGGRGWKRFYW
ncbi:MAG TPA: PepSY-associated TM helix domain-containing protein [Planctomycetota bacterium]|nr:PepSY-associated TM helix domain-containing protein [Planctomycetota bacterium]